MENPFDSTPGDQLLMGFACAAVSLVGLIKSQWFFEETKKGRWLARTFGEQAGLAILRILFVLAIVFGVGLAANLFRPLSA